ncbi:MAG: TolB family protein [Spirochaetota bacterium]
MTFKKKKRLVVFTCIFILTGVVLITGCAPGRQRVVLTEPAYNNTGDKIAFVSNQDGDTEIYVVNSDGTNLKKLTDNSSVDFSPTWSPDGDKIVFVSDRSGKFELYTMNADGSDQKLIPTSIEEQTTKQQ